MIPVSLCYFPRVLYFQFPMFPLCASLFRAYYNPSSYSSSVSLLLLFQCTIFPSSQGSCVSIFLLFQCIFPKPHVAKVLHLQGLLYLLDTMFPNLKALCRQSTVMPCNHGSWSTRSNILSGSCTPLYRSMCPVYYIPRSPCS